MVASQRPSARTASMCVARAARGTHSFNISDYNLHRGLGYGNFIRSATFSVGGYDWCLRCYPDGHEFPQQGSRGDLAACLELLTENAKVRAAVVFSLIDISGGESFVRYLEDPKVFNSRDVDGNVCWGITIMSISELEQSRFLRGDCLIIECDVTVIKRPRVAKPAVAPKVQVPLPLSCLLDNLGKLLESGDEADVTYTVKGESFPAHKIMLAVQSPVFKAELYGPMRDTRKSIVVEDMEPVVFKALLRFIYTDSLPSMDDLGGDDKAEMLKHLLVVADRYGMERMKLMCESIICKSLDFESVDTTLVLADQPHCSNLKDACIDFINSLTQKDDLVASQGYEHLKRSCPAVFVDVFERATKSQKI